MKLKLFFTFLLLSSSVLAQDTVYKYFDENWLSTEKDEFSNIRKIYPVNDSVYKIIDFYPNGYLQMTGRVKVFCDSPNWTLIQEHEHSGCILKDGDFIYYYRSGKKKFRLRFKENEEIGNDSTWYEKGNISNVVVRDDFSVKNVERHKSFYPNGNLQGVIEISSNGKFEGLWQEYYENGVLAYETSYEDNLAVDSATEFYDNGQKKKFYLIENGFYIKESVIEWSEFDFLSECDSLEVWNGGIQGIDNDSLTCCYTMAQCNTNKDYDLIIFENESLKLNRTIDFIGNQINDDLKNIIYYAFEIDKKESENPENEFDVFEYVYPSNVNVYRRFEDGWRFILTEKVESFQELGKLKQRMLLGHRIATK